MSQLWEATQREKQGYCMVHSPDKKTVLFCFDSRFARVLAHVINSTSSHKLEATNEEMDLRGVPQCLLT